MARLNHAVRQATHVGDPRTADQVRADTLAALGWHGRPDRAGPAAAAATTDVLPAAGPAGPAGSPAASRSCPWCAGGPVDPCQAAWAGRVIARVQVTIGIDTLLALTDDPARVSTDGRSAGSTDWGWTPAGTARELLAQPGTEWQRFLHDQTGLLLGVSRAHPIPEPLRRLALARYTRCTFPAAPAPTAANRPAPAPTSTTPCPGSPTDPASHSDPRSPTPATCTPPTADTTNSTPTSAGPPPSTRTPPPSPGPAHCNRPPPPTPTAGPRTGGTPSSKPPAPAPNPHHHQHHHRPHPTTTTHPSKHNTWPRGHARTPPPAPPAPASTTGAGQRHTRDLRPQAAPTQTCTPTPLRRTTAITSP